MKEIIKETTLQGIQSYIEKKENVKLECKMHYKQTKPQGHLPHYDYGYDSKGKPNYSMDWCIYSASVLKTTDYEGGEFIFVDDDNNEIEVIDKIQHLNHALVFDVSYKHKVNPHTNGKRTVELFFFGKK